MVWDREDGRTTVESYWILDVDQELESFPASGFLGKTYALRLSGCISPIPCGLGWT
jgi:hypothetical protein